MFASPVMLAVLIGACSLMGMKVHAEPTEQIVILSAASRAFCSRKSCTHDFRRDAKSKNLSSFQRASTIAALNQLIENGFDLNVCIAGDARRICPCTELRIGRRIDLDFSVGKRR